MQTERNAKEKWEKQTFLFIAEAPLILSKGTKTSENKQIGAYISAGKAFQRNVSNPPA